MSFVSTRLIEDVLLHRRALLGGDVGAELLRPARLRFAPGLAWPRSPESLRRRPSPRRCSATPVKSRELEPPQKTKVAPIEAEDHQGQPFLALQTITNSLQHPCDPESEPKKIGGADGTRTRDPRRDRPVF